MAFVKKTWVDRVSEEPQRRTLTDVNSGTTQTVDVERAEGVVTQDGDAFSATNMNNLESRIDEGLKSYLTIGNVPFYFDYQGGKYGFNTDPQRGANTFSPFRTAHTQIYTPTSRAAALDMGEYHEYRYVNTNSVPNSNSGTYTFASGDTGGTKDLGETNTYRYVNATNVYNAGKEAEFSQYGFLHCNDSSSNITALLPIVMKTSGSVSISGSGSILKNGTNVGTSTTFNAKDMITLNISHRAGQGGKTMNIVWSNGASNPELPTSFSCGDSGGYVTLSFSITMTRSGTIYFVGGGVQKNNASISSGTQFAKNDVLKFSLGHSGGSASNVLSLFWVF